MNTPTAIKSLALRNYHVTQSLFASAQLVMRQGVKENADHFSSRLWVSVRVSAGVQEVEVRVLV